jgi:hypothetical protein
MFQGNDCIALQSLLVEVRQLHPNDRTKKSDRRRPRLLKPVRFEHLPPRLRLTRLRDQLAQTPAKSVTGIALKLVTLFQWDDDLRDAWSGKSDPEYGDIMCLAARADALRLAGLPHMFGIDEPEGGYVDIGQDGA